MSHSTHSIPQRREALEKQLFILLEEKGQFLDQYYPQQGKERTSMDHFLTQYTTEVGKLLSESLEDTNDVVLIGSCITMEYLDYGEKDTFTIVFPEDADPDDNRISFLSPVGRQLLLAKLDETLVIAAPAGSMQVRITAIIFH